MKLNRYVRYKTQLGLFKTPTWDVWALTPTVIITFSTEKTEA